MMWAGMRFGLPPSMPEPSKMRHSMAKPSNENTQDNPQPAPRLAKLNYEVVRPIGSGAGSTILLIRAKPSGQRFALKVVKRLGAEDDIYIDQAQHEFAIAGRLDHQAIVRIFDCRIHRKLFKVVGVDLLMEYLDGRPIDDVEGLDLGVLLILFIQVASALGHMHRRGIYHGDIKPSNIMLTRTGRVKVIDFGTAWIRGQDKNRVQGTPEYMAPEQIGDKTVDVKTDVYNFGATVYRLVTGAYANVGFAGLGGPSVTHPPRDLNPDVPEALEEIILDCLQPRRRERAGDILEIRERLVELARSLHVRKQELRDAARQALGDEGH